MDYPGLAGNPQPFTSLHTCAGGHRGAAAGSQGLALLPARSSDAGRRDI